MFPYTSEQYFQAGSYLGMGERPLLAMLNLLQKKKPPECDFNVNKKLSKHLNLTCSNGMSKEI